MTNFDTESTLSTLNRRPISISLLLLLLIGSLLYRTISSAVVVVVLTNGISQSHGLLSIFSIAPLICLLPIITAISVVFFIYLFQKTRDTSSSSYNLLLISLIILPVLYTLLIYLLFSQTQAIYNYTAIDTSNPQSNLLQPIISAVLTEINLLSLFTILLVIAKKTLFTNPSSGLSWLSKITLMILGSIILIPTLIITFSVISNSLSPDTNYAQVRRLVGHKLYSPTTLPQDLVIASQYYLDEKNSLNLSNPTVKVAFDVPQNQKSAGAMSKIIILSQSLITDDFNLTNYLIQQNSNKTPQPVQLTKAKNKTGYLIAPPPSTSDKLSVKSLYLITPDNIFIGLASISPQIESQDLIDLANSLE